MTVTRSHIVVLWRCPALVHNLFQLQVPVNTRCIKTREEWKKQTQSTGISMKALQFISAPPMKTAKPAKSFAEGGKSSAESSVQGGTPALPLVGWVSDFPIAFTSFTELPSIKIAWINGRVQGTRVITPITVWIKMKVRFHVHQPRQEDRAQNLSRRLHTRMLMERSSHGTRACACA